MSVPSSGPGGCSQIGRFADGGEERSIYEGDFAVRGVSHVSLSVTDLDRSFAFYRDVLSFAVLMQPFDATAFEGREAVVVAGRVAINLQAHHRNGGSLFDPTRTGLDHLAFHLSDVGALDEWASRLRGLGVECSDPKKVAYGWIVEFRDPDGIQLELFARE